MIIMGAVSAVSSLTFLQAGWEIRFCLLILIGALTITLSWMRTGPVGRTWFLVLGLLTMLGSASLPRPSPASSDPSDNAGQESGLRSSLDHREILEFSRVEGIVICDSQVKDGELQEVGLRIVRLYSAPMEIEAVLTTKVSLYIFAKERFFIGERIIVEGRVQAEGLAAEDSSMKPADRLRPVLSASDSAAALDPRRGESIAAHASDLLAGLRRKVITAVYGRLSALSPSAAELGAALLLGRREDRANPVLRYFLHSGCAHLLALSGMHLQILGMLSLRITAPFLKPRYVKLTTAVVCIFFTFIAGPRPSLVRSLIFTLLNFFFRRRTDPHGGIRMLIASFLIQTVVMPPGKDAAGYYLSYAALAGILIGARLVSDLLPGLIPPGIRTGLAASISASLFSLPLMTGYFGIVYPFSPLAALVLTPLVTLYMMLSLVMVLPISLIESVLVFFLEALFQGITRAAAAFSHLPSIHTDSIPGIVASSIGTALLLTGLVVFEYAVSRKRCGI